MSMKATHRFAVALGVVLAIGAVTGLTVCDLLFGCGCEPLWADSSAHCDINVPGPPDCPVCAGSATRRAAFGGFVGIAIVGAMVGAARNTAAGMVGLVVVGTVSYLVATTVAGGVLAAIDGNQRFGAAVRAVPPPQHPDAR